MHPVFHRTDSGNCLRRCPLQRPRPAPDAPEWLEQRIAPAGATTYVWNGTVSTDWTDAANWTPHGVPGINDSVVLNIASTINVAAPVAVLSFTESAGTIAGAGSIGILSAMEWSGGSIALATTINNTASLTIDNPADVTLDGVVLNLNGPVTWSGGGNIIFNGPAGMLVAKSFDIETDASFAATGAGTKTIAVLSNGTFQKSAGSGTTDFPAALAFTNAGTLNLNSGTLQFDGPFTQNTGSTTLQGGSLATSGTLSFQNGQLNGVGTIAGNVTNTGGILQPGGAGATGMLAVTGDYTQGSGATLSIEIAGPAQADQLAVLGTATLGGALSAASLGGYQAGVGDVFDAVDAGTRTGTFASVSTGPLNLTAEYTVTAARLVGKVTAYVWDGGAGDSNWFAPANWSPNGVPGPSDTATLDTAATINLTNSVTVANFTQTNGALGGNGILAISSSFVWSGGTQGGTGTTQVQFGGTWEISGAAAKTLTGRTLNIFGDTTWTGAGNIVFNSGLLRNEPGAFFDIQTDADLVDADGSSTVATFFNIGTLYKSVGAPGSDATELSGVVFNDSGPTALVSGELRVAGGGGANSASIDIEAGAQLTLLSHFTLNGGSQLNGLGTLLIDSGGTLDTADPLTLAGTLDLRSGGTLTGAGDLSLDGAATWTGGTMSGAGKTMISPTGTLDDSGVAAKTLTRSLTNDGTLIVESGTLTFGGGFTQTGGITMLNGGNLAQAGTMAFQGGSLAGAGTISASVMNGGATVQPGGAGAVGIIAITGDYLQTGGSLEVEISGTVPGTQFDQLTVSGTATLGGTLKASLLNGFVPGFGDSFAVLPYANHTGAFTTVNLPPSTAASALATAFTVNSTVPAPPSISVANAIVLEGNAATTPLTFTLTLDHAQPDVSVTVKFATSDFTAHAGSDYTAQSGTVTFPPGATQQTVTIDVTGDTLAESRERFHLTLSDPTSATIGDGAAFGIIQDDDHHFIAAGSGHGGALGIFQTTASAATQVGILHPFGAAFQGAVRVAVGDINGDGVDDFVAGAGSGRNGHVRVLDGTTMLPFADAPHSAFADLSAFPGYRGGVFVAVGDVNGDGAGDLIVSTGSGHSNMVKVFSGADATLFTSFQAFQGSVGGVRVAAGDVNGDGYADIVAGTGKGSAVRTFDIHEQPVMPVTLQSFTRIFAKSYLGGVHVATGDLADPNHLGAVDGTDDLIIGAGASRPDVRIVPELSTAPAQTILAYARPFHGVRVAAADVNGDGIADLIAAQGAAGRARGSVLSGLDFTKLFDFTLQAKNSDGIYVG